MTKRQLLTRPSDRTAAQIEDLKAWTGETQTTIQAKAVEMYWDKVKQERKEKEG